MTKHGFDIRLERAFVPMPSQMKSEIEYAFERGEKEMKKRYKIMSLLSVAAVISVAFAMAALAVNEINVLNPDRVVAAGENMQKVEGVPATSESGHFYEGDFAEPEALYILLSNAYWNYAHENNLEMDSRAVFAAAEELSMIFEKNKGDKTQMTVPVRECLESALGLDSEFIASHYLTNDVLGCLYGAAESIYLEEVVVLEPVPGENVESREEVNQEAVD